MRPNEKERLDSQVLPKKMNPFDRFFAALLRSSPQEFLEAHTIDSKADALWAVICQRVGLTALTAPIPAYVPDAQQHFDLRAALVLEEARHAISQPLAQKWKQQQQQRTGGKNNQDPNPVIGTMTLTAHYREQGQSQYQQQSQSSNLGHAKIVFCKQHSPFTKDELFNIRPGTVFECLPVDGQQSIQNVVLGVVGSGKREKVEKSRSFTLFIFRDVPVRIEDTDWILSPVNTLITELRQYEAMTCKISSVGFLQNLLGNKGPSRRKHTWLDSDDDETPPPAATATNGVMEDYFPPAAAVGELQADGPAPMFQIPRLNPSQSKAASAFLKSGPNSITLIQGPPGTGTYESICL
jgi:hypothetical protein